MARATQKTAGKVIDLMRALKDSLGEVVADPCPHCGNSLAQHPMTFPRNRLGILTCSGVEPEPSQPESPTQ